MEILIKPNREVLDKAIQRPTFEQKNLDATIKDVFDAVSEYGDEALALFSKKFDLCPPSEQKVSCLGYGDKLSKDLKKAISQASENIRKFHSAQQSSSAVIETMAGVECWRKSVGIEKVGIYIPGGSAPLFSTVLMLAIPADIAGCKEIVVCTPPDLNGQLNPAIAYALEVSGISEVNLVGGAQAIAAMTLGTESIAQVDKLFGPGNQYVTYAKQYAQKYGVAIDMPAGPSEVLVIADEAANPEFIAADLLSQAEHGEDSQVILLTNSESTASRVKQATIQQLDGLSRKEIARKALDFARIIVLDSLEDCVRISNQYAPEHLIINTSNADDLLDGIINAGSVFVGAYSPESVGDYASGTNHTLPTNGYARSYSGVNLASFQKQITFQRLSTEGIQNIGEIVEVMAENEGLDAHKNAVTVRLNTLK